jgi:hypothetical protein
MALGKRQNPFKAGSRSRLFFYGFRVAKAVDDPSQPLALPQSGRLRVRLLRASGAPSAYLCRIRFPKIEAGASGDD